MEGGVQPSTQEPASEGVKPENTTSTSSVKFRSNYDSLLKEVLDESSEDEQEIQINSFDIDVNAATAELPVELRAALEDRALAEKYLANLRSFMSQHQRSLSIASVQSMKGEHPKYVSICQILCSSQHPLTRFLTVGMAKPFHPWKITHQILKTEKSFIRSRT
jgi:ribosomal protein L16 Arg81 hydroxylase